MKIYFLTGATGVVGSALVPLLLQDDKVAVRLLMRARTAEHLKARLDSLMQYWGFGSSQAGIDGRIKALRGDIKMSKFGLNSDSYLGLARDCTHLIHCAGNVRMNLTLAEARESSVRSVRNVCELAEACRQYGSLKKIEIVSTVGVGGKNAGLIPETWITNDREFHNTYEMAKAEAESYIVGNFENDLPITIHRPSMIVGDSQTGKIISFQIFYHLCEFLSGKRTFGLYPDMGDSRLDTIPVDYVARAIVWSSGQASTSRKIFHLCSGPEQSTRLVDLVDEVREIFSSFNYKLPKKIVIPSGTFRSIVGFGSWFVPPKLRRVVRTLPIFLEYLKENQMFANNNTRSVLNSAGIELPPVDAYLHRVVRYYLETKSAS